MKSAVTVSLVTEARGGPFVFWDDLERSAAEAARLGFDAIELFATGPDQVPKQQLRQILNNNALALAAVGTGAGWVKHRLTLTSHDQQTRAAAVDFIKRMIDFGGEFQAPAIIGSMQGRTSAEVNHSTALQYLKDALAELGEYAQQYGTMLLYEPLNRYETDLINLVNQANAVLDGSGSDHVKLLCDLFHMNIEEANIATALRAAGNRLGHVHFVDSNRQAVGLGHIDIRPIVTALQEISFAGYLSVEAFAKPDSLGAATQAKRAFDEWTRLDTFQS